MKKYNYLLISCLTLYFTGCQSSDKIKVKKEEPKVKLHPRQVEKDSVKKVQTLSHTLQEQNAQEALNNYLNDLSCFNIDAVVEMTYPRLFNVINIDLFRQYLSAMMNAKDIEIQSFTTNVTNLSSTTHFSNATSFAQADYNSRIVIHFLNDELYSNTKKINFLYDSLVHKYGKENVEFNVSKRTFIIKKAEKLLMIKEQNSPWKFLGNNIKYRKLYPSFLPQEILTNL